MQMFEDDELNEEFGPSRSQQRRDALAILDMAEKLVGLKTSDLDRVPLGEDLRSVVDDTVKIKSNIAHKRQLHFLAKQLRREDDAFLDAIRNALAIPAQAQRAATQQLHKMERWRERLLNEGDDALGEFIHLFPNADRQRLRQLLRNCKDEKSNNKPPVAFRELFGLIRDAYDIANASAESDGLQEHEDLT